MAHLPRSNVCVIVTIVIVKDNDPTNKKQNFFKIKITPNFEDWDLSLNGEDKFEFRSSRTSSNFNGNVDLVSSDGTN